ncbi:MAG: iron ABC transporter substrate-binding protein [Dactylosporangium sp.]|nr:iron ABC transporter substrate-binding protein [Dactylosporangium sp.]NNJ62026.1 iron ABC transporter substrate-binding protein [Dactylosporangium sp.]
MERKRVARVSALLCLTAALAGCSASGPAPESGEGTAVTDALGRRVTVAGPVSRVVAIGPGALRLVCYFQEPGLVAGIERLEVDHPAGRPYLLANPALARLPVIGQGGPNNAPDPEKVLAVRPDVIFTTYASDQAAANNLQSQTGIPVVALSYGTTSTFDPAVNTSLTTVGTVLGRQRRATELVEIIGGFQADLDARTRDVPEEEKPSVYVGGLGSRGTHGIESTQGGYALFDAVHARNVVDETGKTGSLMIDKEQIIQWNPDKIFFDGAGFPSVLDDYRKNEQLYQTLSAVRAGELYAILPYNYYTTNIETAIADAYYIGKTLYPDRFDDVDPAARADDIYRAFLGAEAYEQMADVYGGFRRVALR